MRFDVIVIGGGHAGAEAANAAARRGASVLLLTQNLETIGQMSCNPAIGGIAKGTVVREVDALGGVMGRATDRAMIQFRMLNLSKGPAVWSPRAQCDRGLYRRAVRGILERQAKLSFAQGTVAELLVESSRVVGIVTTQGERVEARCVVVTAGTFLRGRIHQGLQTQIPAGRAGESPSVELAQALEAEGITIKRFKTGTPPRIDGRSVDLAQLTRQDGDPAPYWFSYHERPPRVTQLPCWLTWAGPEVRQIIERHLHESALYGGAISGRGPRYCPSIEDKIVKFAQAERHQIFLEPEGLDTEEMYVNGMSTSLPAKVQLEMLRAVPGLDQVRMTRAGYAIEYDYFPPTQLTNSLETKAISGLFFAGQVNGTTGYEEAAGQGLVAGLNAAGSALELEPVILGRNEAMTGVLVDDLVSRGVDEPYRLFTSRAEYRLLLRQDNALRRLLPRAESLGLLEVHDLEQAQARLAREESVSQFLHERAIRPDIANPMLESWETTPIQEPVRLAELARRPEAEMLPLLRAAGWDGADEDATWGEIELRYAGYLTKEAENVARLAEMNSFELPVEFDYRALRTISFEAREKLSEVRPETLGRAARIPGVNPADLQNLVLEVMRAAK